jgi:hypothetical protein
LDPYKIGKFPIEIPGEITHTSNFQIWHVVIFVEISYVRQWKMKFVSFFAWYIMVIFDLILRIDPWCAAASCTMWISFIIQSDCVLKKFLNFLKIKNLHYLVLGIRKEMIIFYKKLSKFCANFQINRAVPHYHWKIVSP